MKISILTPTYNRSQLLLQLYESILQNVEKYPNVEWLIMDDGSVDDTKSIVESWIEQKKLDIKYFYQTNAGKMSALNELVQKVTGDLIIEMDSDDIFLNDIFLQIAKDYKNYYRDDIYGFGYLKKIKGKNTTCFPNIEKPITLYQLYYEYQFKGQDIGICFIASKRKLYKHQLFENEKFITEAYLYHKMDVDYQGIILINTEIMLCEYLEDGYTKQIQKIFYNNPKGYYQYFLFMLNMVNKKVSTGHVWYMLKHYLMFSVLTKKKMKDTIYNLDNKLIRLLVIILYVPSKIVTIIRRKRYEYENCIF